MRQSVNDTGDEYMDDPADDLHASQEDINDLADFMDDTYTHGDYFGFDYLARYDDDPNPYHGDYSEM